MKKLGSIDEIINKIEALISPFKIDANTYEEIFNAVTKLKEKWIDFSEGPFKDKQNEYVFYLTKLEGKQRNKLLSITDELYENKELAKKWYRNISKYVHPDVISEKEDEALAFQKLHELYEVMNDEDGDSENE